MDSPSEVTPVRRPRLQRVVVRKTRNSTSSNMADSSRVCRICCTTEPEEDIVEPCKCKGSARFVHQECLLQWLVHSPDPNHCEICRSRLAVVPHQPTSFEYIASHVKQLTLENIRNGIKTVLTHLFFSVTGLQQCDHLTCLVVRYMCVIVHFAVMALEGRLLLYWLHHRRVLFPMDDFHIDFDTDDIAIGAMTFPINWIIYGCVFDISQRRWNRLFILGSRRRGREHQPLNFWLLLAYILCFAIILVQVWLSLAISELLITAVQNGWLPGICARLVPSAARRDLFYINLLTGENAARMAIFGLVVYFLDVLIAESFLALYSHSTAWKRRHMRLVHSAAARTESQALHRD